MNLYVNREIAKAFRETSKRYGGRIGVCASASFLMFLEADPKVQGEYLSKVFQLDLTDQVEDMLQAVREEQARRVSERERAEEKSGRRRA